MNSHSVFQTLLSVEKKHGVNLGQTYVNDKACQHFISEIGGVMADDLQVLFQRQPFYCSLIFDGSTDKSVSEKEIVSIEMLEDGVTTVRLLGIMEARRCDAEAIHDATKCQEMQLDITNSCVATAADGASVNFGKNNGVLNRLQSSMPWFIKIHCVAHRLELALTDALKGSY